MTEDVQDALSRDGAETSSSSIFRPRVPTTRGPDHLKAGPSLPPKRPPSRGKARGHSLSTTRLASADDQKVVGETPSSQHGCAVEEEDDAERRTAHTPVTAETAEGGGMEEGGAENFRDQHHSPASQAMLSVVPTPPVTASQDQVEEGPAAEVDPHDHDRIAPTQNDELVGVGNSDGAGGEPVFWDMYQSPPPWLKDMGGATDGAARSSNEGFGGAPDTGSLLSAPAPDSGAVGVPSSGEKPRAPVDPRPWRTNAKPIKPGRSKSRKAAREVRDISAVTQIALETYASSGEKRQAPTTALGVLLEECMQCSDLASQYDTFNALQRVMRRNEQHLERLHRHDKLEERRGALLNMELFRLRDEYIRKWRTDLTGAVLVFDYKGEQDDDDDGKLTRGGAIAPTRTLGEDLRSNVVISDGASRGRNKRASSNRKGGSAPAAYTEAQWEAERLHVLDEMKIWKTKSNELRHHVNRGTNIKNLHSLQPVSAHDPLHRSSRTVTRSAPDPSGTDCLAELRLDLSKQYALCREAERQLDAAQGMNVKHQLIQQQQQHVAEEEEKNKKEALSDLLNRLETAVREKEALILTDATDSSSCKAGYARQIKKAKDTVERGRKLLESLSP